jgi:triacylglycerol lipase
MSRPLPIILAHGIARFDILLEIQRQKFNLPNNPLDDEFQYFKGIRTHLEAHGFKTFHSNTSWAGSLNLRATRLGNRINEVIRQTGAPKVHIIAHSMGGLDARQVIVDLNMADKVASLTTVGTPHLGTVLADHVLAHGGQLLMEILGKAVNIDLQGFRDLTVAACEQFNQRAEGVEAENKVFYQTYASFEDVKQVFTPLIPSWLFIRENEGRNDGLVSFNSQQWKPQLVAPDGTTKNIIQKEFPVPADYLNQIGWWDLEETILFGRNLLRQKKTYENKIKAIYLQIAKDVEQLPAIP